MKCFTCESTVVMPFNCKFCSQKYCDEHRLPEDHECQGLQLYKEEKITNFREGKNMNMIYSSKKAKTKTNFLQPIIDLIETNPNLYVGLILLTILFTLLIL